MYGLEILRLLYALGCATTRDVATITGLERRTVNRQLLLLHRSRYVERIKARVPWDLENGLPYIYTLSRNGVPLAGGVAGVEDEDEARKRYRRCRASSLFSHRLMQTRFVALLAEATLHYPNYRVVEYWGEHAPEFPIKGAGKGIYGSPLSMGLKSGDIQPDGRIDIACRFENLQGGADQHLSVLLELETGSRPLRDVYAKVVAYLSHLESLCATGEPYATEGDPGGRKYRAHPEGGWPAVLFLFPTESAAHRAYRYVWERLEQHDQYMRWVVRMTDQHEVDPARFFLFGSLAAMSKSPTESLTRALTPLEPHQGGNEKLGRVSILDVAYHSGWITLTEMSEEAR